MNWKQNMKSIFASGKLAEKITGINIKKRPNPVIFSLQVVWGAFK